jgi:signal transduction histidine kinase
LRLAPRLALTFGLLAAVSTAGVGLAVRYRLADRETKRFQREVRGVCDRVIAEVKRQAEADQKLIMGACQSGSLVDHTVIELDRGALDEWRRSLSVVVAEERDAFDVDELVLAVQGGDIVGASPPSLLGLRSKDVDELLAGGARPTIRLSPSPGLVSRCTKKGDSGRFVGLVATRHLEPLIERLAKTLDVKLVPTWPRVAAAATAAAPPAPDDDLPPPAPKRAGKTKPGASSRPAPSPPKPVPVAPSAAPASSASAATASPANVERATCTLDADGATLTFDVLKSKKELDESLDDVNQAVFVSAAISALVAFLVAVVLARSMSRPLSVLATEAGKVAGGEARPLGVKGSGEIQELVRAFDGMIQDLAVTRRRLAAASRVAAWREVARRVAHEVKNPLAPIRAAVETLRRLRAREDPAFDGYFDEATRTVLDEVHRISNIVTEFTRFARLPAPKPQEVDVEDVARHVVGAHKAAAGDAILSHVARRRAPLIRADRDQVIQVLTNLVQNALDAVKGGGGGAVTLTTDTDGHYVAFTVADDGPGIAPEIAGRLFEPYATTKASGTGLGLAIAQRIAIEHNGELSYVGPSANGRGAVFRLLLPVEGPPPLSEAPSSDG